MELLFYYYYYLKKKGNEVGLWVNGLGWIRQLLKSQTQTLIWVTLPAMVYHFQVSELKLSSHLIFIATHSVISVPRPQQWQCPLCYLLPAPEPETHLSASSGLWVSLNRSSTKDSESLMVPHAWMGIIFHATSAFGDYPVTETSIPSQRTRL